MASSATHVATLLRPSYLDFIQMLLQFLRLRCLLSVAQTNAGTISVISVYQKGQCIEVAYVAKVAFDFKLEGCARAC